MSRSKKQNLTPSCEVLQGLFENGKSPLSDQFVRWKLWRKWPDVVGTLSAHCKPVGYNDGTLVICAKNSSWLQQLLFFRDMIKDKVNQFVGRPWVHRVHLTVDERKVPNLDESAKDLKDYLDR